MAYMTRLGLWGPGTPFTAFQDFIDAIEKRFNIDFHYFYCLSFLSASDLLLSAVLCLNILIAINAFATNRGVLVIRTTASEIVLYCNFSYSCNTRVANITEEWGAMELVAIDVKQQLLLLLSK